ncbi:prephenate dehydratase [Pyrobaculum neutrophilum]|uniref:prephenate dehydratase n=1 Tax=Pyrobaculum neutrophilum (strain DSM 2338 / JCM 9278 / NBRC 100436 / V24Sta) TaxID=444157 RepID=B1YA86_PYRNV|nr:prephenate dehydratase [Pyrobaculum neutrophilum]ACB39060.1 Prephenate dehydratase [Pyrobaculum neutrophilum V24Sta]
MFINAGVYRLEEELYALLRERAKYNVPPLIDGPLAPLIASAVSRAHSPAVAYLGPERSFTWEAAASLYPHGTHVAYKTITEVFKAVEKGAVDYGVVPFINSLEGPVGETVDALATHDVKILAMGEMRITLCLAKRGTPRVVYTHPHAAAQARKIISALGAEVVYTASTSEAVRELERCQDCAVIASPKALEGYEKTCGVEDGESYTRFAVLSREGGPGGSRAALIFAVPNVAGALYKALGPIARRGINMTLIYSRPTKLSPWDYFFLVEVEAGAGVEEALEEMRLYTTVLKLAGRYNIITIAQPAAGPAR